MNDDTRAIEGPTEGRQWLAQGADYPRGGNPTIRVYPAQLDAGGSHTPICKRVKFKAVHLMQQKVVPVVHLEVAEALEMSRDYWKRRYHAIAKAAERSKWENLWANGTNGHPTNRSDY